MRILDHFERFWDRCKQVLGRFKSRLVFALCNTTCSYRWSTSAVIMIRAFNRRTISHSNLLLLKCPISLGGRSFFIDLWVSLRGLGWFGYLALRVRDAKWLAITAFRAARGRRTVLRVVLSLLLLRGRLEDKNKSIILFNFFIIEVVLWIKFDQLSIALCGTCSLTLWGILDD